MAPCSLLRLMAGWLQSLPPPAAAAQTVESSLVQPGLEAVIDRRTIRASRVNMRQGPGTSYPVITRLLGGEEVIVIEDSGTGWLHLPRPGQGAGRLDCPLPW